MVSLFLILTCIQVHLEDDHIYKFVKKSICDDLTLHMKLIPLPEMSSHSFKLALHRSLMFVYLNIGHTSQDSGQMSCSAKKAINCDNMIKFCITPYSLEFS